MFRWIINRILKKEIGVGIDAVRNAFKFNRLERDSDDIGFSYLYSALMPNANGEIPAATACIDILSEALAGADMQVVINDANQRQPEFVPQPNHPLKLLFNSPFREWDAYQFWTWYFRCLVRNGNAYALIRRNGNRGRGVELIPANASGLSLDGRKQKLNIFQNGTWNYHADVDKRDILSMHLSDFDGDKASAPIMRARAISDLIDQILLHHQSLVRDGLHFRNALISDEKAVDLTKEQRKELAEEIQNYYSGTKSPAKMLVMPKGMTPVKLEGLSSTEMEMMAILTWGMTEVSRVFRVPPHMIYHHLAGKTNDKADIEMLGEDFYRMTLSAHFKRAESAICKKLLVVHEKFAGYSVEITSDEMRRGSWSQKANVAQLLVTRGGILTINEGRAIAGYPPRADGDRLINPTGTASQGIGTNSNDNTDIKVENKHKNNGFTSIKDVYKMLDSLDIEAPQLPIK